MVVGDHRGLTPKVYQWKTKYMKTRKPRGKCLISKCPRIESCRGMCGTCYNTARIMIKNKEATEDQFVAKGLMLPRNPKGFSLLKEEFAGSPVKIQFFSRV
jgi:hypothetical protein